MSRLSKTGQWDKMTALVDDEILEKCVITALYDDLAETIEKRYGHLIERIEVSFPVDDGDDFDQLKQVVHDLAN